MFFKDTITAALALPSFAEMILRKYREKEVHFLLSEQELPFRNEALLNAVTPKLLAFSSNSSLHKPHPLRSLPFSKPRLMNFIHPIKNIRFV